MNEYDIYYLPAILGSLHISSWVIKVIYIYIHYQLWKSLLYFMSMHRQLIEPTITQCSSVLKRAFVNHAK